jgi:antitoxin component YwqK of YwqJK toxin-antitoxin module
MLFLQDHTKEHQVILLNKLLIIVLIFCFFGCKEGSDSQLSYDQKNNKTMYNTVDKSKLDLHSNEGKWYYKGKPFTGNAVTYYIDKKKKELILFFEGKKNGLSQKWYSNGKLQKESFYKNNKLEGEGKSWWEDGKLASESFYINGVGNGVQKEWHPNGKMSKLTTLKNGVEEGIQQAWLENGKVYVNCEMKNGRTFGLKKAILCYELKKEEVQYEK